MGAAGSQRWQVERDRKEEKRKLAVERRGLGVGRVTSPRHAHTLIQKHPSGRALARLPGGAGGWHGTAKGTDFPALSEFTFSRARQVT